MNRNVEIETLGDLLKKSRIALVVGTARSSLVYRPDVFEDKLHEHGLQVASFQMLSSEYTLRLRIQVVIAPKYFLQYLALDTKLFLVQGSELPGRECPSIDGGAEDDIVSFGLEVDIVIFLLLVFGRSFAGDNTLIVFFDAFGLAFGS